MRDEFGLRGLEDGKHGSGTTEVKQTMAVCGDMLVVAGAGAEEVAQLVGRSSGWG